MRNTRKPILEAFCCCFDFKKGLTNYAVLNLFICGSTMWKMRYMMFRENYSTDIFDSIIFFTAPIDTVFTVILVIATHMELPWVLIVVATYNFLWVLLYLALIIYVILFVTGIAGHYTLPITVTVAFYLLIPVLWIVYRAYVIIAIISFAQKVELEKERKDDDIQAEAV